MIIKTISTATAITIATMNCNLAIQKLQPSSFKLQAFNP